MTKLNVVVDCSGSMIEMGKLAILQSICVYLKDVCLSEVTFYKWHEALTEFDGTLIVSDLKQSVSLIGLKVFLQASDQAVNLILTDACFETQDLKILKTYLKTENTNRIVFYPVGADSDLTQFKQMNKLLDIGVPNTVDAALKALLLELITLEDINTLTSDEESWDA